MKFYRYEHVEYATTDRDGEFCSPRFPDPKVELREYNLHKETLKGYWIGYGEMIMGMKGYQKWVSKTAKKRYAYPTKQEALVNFIKRNEKRIKILSWQLDICKIAVKIANDMLSEEIQSIK